MRIITPTVKYATWSDLKVEATLGNLGSILHTGDKIPVSLSDGQEIVFRTMKDECEKWYFVLEDCYKDFARMNQRDTTAGGWAESDMRTWLRTVYEKLPDDLKEVIAPTTIIQVDGDTQRETRDKLFLLSATQVFGNGRWSAQEPYDTQLNYFKKRINRIKWHETQGLCPWWLRSAGSSSGFYNVNSSGGYYDNYAGSAYGVVFGFCIES